MLCVQERKFKSPMQTRRTFVSISDAAISYQQTAGEQTIQKQDVRSVKLMKTKHRLLNTAVLGGLVSKQDNTSSKQSTRHLTNVSVACRSSVREPTAGAVCVRNVLARLCPVGRLETNR